MNAITFYRMMEQMMDEELFKLPEDVRENILAEMAEKWETTCLTFDLVPIIYRDDIEAEADEEYVWEAGPVTFDTQTEKTE